MIRGMQSTKLQLRTSDSGWRYHHIQTIRIFYYQVHCSEMSYVNLTSLLVVTSLALSSKTQRINKLFNNATLRRVQVSTRDVAKPFVAFTTHKLLHYVYGLYLSRGLICIGIFSCSSCHCSQYPSAFCLDWGVTSRVEQRSIFG
jgi:hypothetical protein